MSVGGELTGVTGNGWSEDVLPPVVSGDGGGGKLTGVTPSHDGGSGGSDSEDVSGRPRSIPGGLTAGVRLESKLDTIALAPKSAGDL